jgi:RHS repeat-associated protein
VSSSNVPDYVEQYVWSLRYIDSPVVCLHDGTLDGDVDDDYAEHGAADWRTYYLTDANHNVTTTIRVDNNNSVVQKGGVDVGIVHYAYTPFGSMTLYNALWASESGCIEDSFDRPLYAGYFFDVETGLYQVRARYYDPSLSRFINRDPIGYNGGMNLYAYCGGNPINATDPMGTDSRLEQLQKDLAEELKQHGNTQWAKTLQWAIDEAQGKDPHDAEMRRNYEDLERARSYSLTHWIMEGLSALESVEHELANQQLIRNVSMGLRQLRYEISVVR